MLPKWLVICALVVFVCATSVACNTVSGVGKDLQKAGEKIEEAAKKNK